MIQRTCPYCTEVFQFQAQPVMDVLKQISLEFHKIEWHYQVSGHIVECRGEWLSLIESEEQDADLR